MLCMLIIYSAGWMTLHKPDTLDSAPHAKGHRKWWKHWNEREEWGKCYERNKYYWGRDGLE